MRHGRILLAAFVVLTLLQLVPIWSARYLPTVDGPSHLYNAWILHGYLTGNVPQAIASRYAIDWRPNPNWLGHAAMALSMVVVPPLVAEKLLCSAIIVLFLAGGWILATAADTRGGMYAFLALPFAYHWVFQMGFYNFSLSVALWMIVVGYWWKRRDHPDARTIATTAALLLACYFSHPMSTALAIGEIGLLWLLTLRGRQRWSHARHLIAFIPASLLLLWFAAQHDAKVTLTHASYQVLLKFLAQTQIIYTFGNWQLAAGTVLFAAFLALTILTLMIERIGRREEDAFLLVFVSLLGLFFWSPSAFAGGTFLTQRLALFLALALLPWYSPRIPAAARITTIVAMMMFAIANAAYLTKQYRDASDRIQELVSAMSAVTSNSMVLPLRFNRDVPGSWEHFAHVTNYAAIEKRLVDLDNYEPGTGHFPIKYAPGAFSPSTYDLEAQPDEVSISWYARSVRFIFTWKMPPDHKLVADLSTYYRLIAESRYGRVYEVKPSFRPFLRPEIILLPLAGTMGDVGSRARWHVDQQLRNTGPRPVRVALSTCASPPCDGEIAPGQALTVVSGNPSQLYVIVETDRSDAAQLEPSTILRRTDAAGNGFQVEIPSVRENEFRRDALVFRNVPLSSATRLHLRLWVINASGSAYSVSIFDANGRKVASRRSATGPDGFANATNLGGLFPELGNIERSVIVVKIEDALPAARAWGFISVTDNRTDIPVLITPDKAFR